MAKLSVYKLKLRSACKGWVWWDTPAIPGVGSQNAGPLGLAGRLVLLNQDVPGSLGEPVLMVKH